MAFPPKPLTTAVMDAGDAGAVPDSAVLTHLAPAGAPRPFPHTHCTPSPYPRPLPRPHPYRSPS